jgi:hypothetical protein
MGDAEVAFLPPVNSCLSPGRSGDPNAPNPAAKYKFDVEKISVDI